MSKMKKTFGTHIEDGLTFMGNGIHRAVMEAKDHELETIKLGLISDGEKLRMLKRDLYEAARSRGNPEHIQPRRHSAPMQTVFHTPVGSNHLVVPCCLSLKTTNVEADFCCSLLHALTLCSAFSFSSRSSEPLAVLPSI